MAVSPYPSIGFTLTCNVAAEVSIDDVAAGASAVAPPDNCRLIVVYNISTTDRIFVKFKMLADATVLTILNSTVIPTGSSMAFGIGYLGDRQPLGIGLACNLYIRPESGGVVPVNITYLQGRGSSTP